MEMGSSSTHGVALPHNVHSTAYSAPLLRYCCHHTGMASTCREPGLWVGLWDVAGDRGPSGALVLSVPVPRPARGLCPGGAW